MFFVKVKSVQKTKVYADSQKSEEENEDSIYYMQGFKSKQAANFI